MAPHERVQALGESNRRQNMKRWQLLTGADPMDHLGGLAVGGGPSGQTLHTGGRARPAAASVFGSVGQTRRCGPPYLPLPRDQTLSLVFVLGWQAPNARPVPVAGWR